MDYRRSLEMSLSREEFFRLLSSAVSAFDVDGDRVHWSDGDRRWTIRLVPMTHRLVAGAVLPRHQVEIVLEACSEEEGDTFMARFHRAFLRGGG
jgi:hypothetical protein